MGKQNRERRAAKQRKQQRARPRPPTSPASGGGVPPDLVQILFSAAQATADGDPDVAGDCATALLTSPLFGSPRVLKAVVDVVADGLLRSWRRGWQPIDLHQVTRRRLAKEHVEVLVLVLGEAMRPYAAATVDPRWLDQLKELGSDAPLDSNALFGRRGKGPGDDVGAVTVALELMALLITLAPITQLMAVPGKAHPHAPSSHGPVDQKVLARVRALLAKAESTEFEQEAEALSAKAQELMTRYSLERLVVEASSDHVDPATACRIWLDAPYAGAKALLVSAVADANRCAAVWSEDLGFVTVVGDEHDLVATELMVTSLLVQATRAMLHPTHRQETRQRSFRQSFLVAYAGRIGERLRDANEHVSADLAPTMGAALVPVLAAHHERVGRARDQMFPRMTSRSVQVSNRFGYAAGRAAADLAVLPTSPQLAT